MTVSVSPAFGSAIAILANGLIVAASLTACPATAPVIVGGDSAAAVAITLVVVLLAVAPDVSVTLIVKSVVTVLPGAT